MAQTQRVRSDLNQSPRSGQKSPQIGAQAHAERVPGRGRTPHGGETSEPWNAGSFEPGPRTRTQLGRKRSVHSAVDTCAFWMLVIGVALMMVGALTLAAWILAAAAVLALFNVRRTRG